MFAFTIQFEHSENIDRLLSPKTTAGDVVENLKNEFKKRGANYGDRCDQYDRIKQSGRL